MERFQFKVQGPRGKWVKLFFSSYEVKFITLESLTERILTRFLNINSGLTLKYFDDGSDWIELPSNDLDSGKENQKRIALKVVELTHTPPPNTSRTSQSQERLRSPYSPSPEGGKIKIHQDKKKTKISGVNRPLESLFNSDTYTAGSTCTKQQDDVYIYETPTQKFFRKMEDVLAQKKVLTMKEKELAELEASFQTPFRNKKPLCSNCHTSGHNRVMCSFAPCVSATICKDIKKHQDEEKHYKSLQMQTKSEKSKLKRLEDDKNSKQESYQASINTFAGEVQTELTAILRSICVLHCTELQFQTGY